MSALAKLSELTDALQFESVDRRAYFDRQTARIVSVADHILSAVEEGEEEALGSRPDWQKEEVETARAIVNHSGDRFIDPPGKFEFNEYRHMERFIGGLPDAKAAEQLRRAIKGHGGLKPSCNRSVPATTGAGSGTTMRGSTCAERGSNRVPAARIGVAACRSAASIRRA